jgi:hypothetical protein
MCVSQLRRLIYAVAEGDEGEAAEKCKTWEEDYFTKENVSHESSHNDETVVH